MEMQFKATVKEVNPIKTGTGSTGKAWSMQTILTETDGQYPKKVELTLFGDMVDKFKVGQTCNFHIEIESRKGTTGDRYFTSVKCWKFDVVGSAPVESSGSDERNTGGIEPNSGLPF